MRRRSGHCHPRWQPGPRDCAGRLRRPPCAWRWTGPSARVLDGCAFRSPLVTGCEGGEPSSTRGVRRQRSIGLTDGAGFEPARAVTPHTLSRLELGTRDSDSKSYFTRRIAHPVPERLPRCPSLSGLNTHRNTHCALHTAGYGHGTTVRSVIEQSVPAACELINPMLNSRTLF